jgi:phosphoserine phosphatase
MSTVVLVRPGCTDFDDQDRIQGTLDVPLNGRGEDQVQQILGAINEMAVQVVLTAPCDPARATAEAIGLRLGVKVKESDGLRNLDQGLWQGLPRDVIRRKYPRVFRQWEESPETICPPEGEALTDALDRVQKALHKPLKKKSSIAVVASEPLATLVECVLTGEKPEFLEASRTTGQKQLVEVIETNGSAGKDKKSKKAKNGKTMPTECSATTDKSAQGET